MSDKTAAVRKAGKKQAMPDSICTNGRILTLEIFVGLAERLMAQEQQMQHVVEDITSIKATVGNLSSDLKAAKGLSNLQTQTTDEKSAKLREHPDFDMLKSQQDQLSSRVSILQQTVEHFQASSLQPPFSHATAAMPLPGLEIAEEGNMLKSSSTHTLDSQQLDQAQLQGQRKEKQYVQMEAVRAADVEEQPQPQAQEGNMLKTASTHAATSEPLHADGRFAALRQESAMLRKLCEENASRLDTLAKVSGSASPHSGLNSESTTSSYDMVLNREYAWQNSMWEASIFIGTGHTWGETLSLSVCLLLNLFLCLFFIVHCQNSLISHFSPYGEYVRSQFFQWQTSVAHDIAYRNPFTGESLASMVCKQKLYSPFATFQFSTVGNVSRYKKSLSGIAAGLSLCLLALTVWYLTLLVELRLILQKMQALVTVPFGPRTKFRVESDGDSTRLLSITKIRVCAVALVEVVRFVVLVCLGVEGTFWLVQEVSLENMILNSVSLAVVLELDELIFSAMLPAAVQKKMNALLPISYTPALGTHSSDLLNILGSFGLLGACLLSVKFLMLDPFLDDIEKTYIALCGETEQVWDFIVAIDSLGIPWVAPSTTVDREGVKETFASWSIKEVIVAGGLEKRDHLTPTQRDNMGTFMQVFSGRQLHRQMTDSEEFKQPTEWTIVDPALMPEIHGWDESMVLVGEDFGNAEYTVYNYYLQFLLNASGYRTCADAPDELCYTLGGSAEAVRMRKLCGVRCGCDRPSVGTVSTPHSDSTSGFAGCASWHTRTDVFINELDKLSCLDTEDSLTFASWSEGLGKKKLGERVTNAFRDGGCYAVAAVDIGDASGSIMNLCSQTSLPAICPQSCGCDASITWSPSHSKTMNFCPYACGRVQRPCVTVYVDHGSKDTGPDGPLVGVACNFPFEYKGTKYETCTFEDWNNPWCGVTLAADGFTSKLWGDCPMDDACIRDEG